MKIINLTQTQYQNYAKNNSYQNFGQTVEFATLIENNHKKKHFLALVDSSNNVLAATLILLINKAPRIKEAIAPNGFLIDYHNFELVEIFTRKLKKYLQLENVTYLITNPMFKNKVYNKQNHLIINNENILNNLYQLGYQNIGYMGEFTKYDIIIENDNGIQAIYNNFNRNTKRNIQYAKNIGLKLQKGTINDLPKVYPLFAKKTSNDLFYYQNLMQNYKNNDNKMELFFVKLNPHRFLITCQNRYEKEKIKNDYLHEKFNKYAKKSSEKLINKKLNSDKTLQKALNTLNYAIKLNQQYQEDFLIGTSLIIRNKREIYFLIDGFNEECRFIYSTHLLKWAIIKKYVSLGYHVFNLGEINQNYRSKQSKYHSQYQFKIGFGGNVIEYPPNLLLIINNFTYSAYQKMKRWTNK